MGDLLKSNVATFRIKELQQCLDLLGLRKAGRKAELSQRLVAFVEQGSPAEVEKKGEQALPGVLANAGTNFAVLRTGSTAYCIGLHMPSGHM